MPKRTDIETIMVIGSGPIVIGQGCEFDYSGVQACKVLRREGYRLVAQTLVGLAQASDCLCVLIGGTGGRVQFGGYVRP